MFPCTHGFHSECLSIRINIENDPQVIKQIQSIEEQLKTLSTRIESRTVIVQRESLQIELDNIVAGDCPLCGYAMIRSLLIPLINTNNTNDLEEKESWNL